MGVLSNRVTVATDGSEGAARADVDVCGRGGADLPTRSGLSRAPRRSGQVLYASGFVLREGAGEMGESLGESPDVGVEVGDPASVIQCVAGERGAGTLVAVGSVSTDIMRRAPGPVLVYR